MLATYVQPCLPIRLRRIPIPQSKGVELWEAGTPRITFPFSVGTSGYASLINYHASQQFLRKLHSDQIPKVRGHSSRTC